MVNEGKTFFKKKKKILKRKSRQDSWYLTGRTKYLMFFVSSILYTSSSNSLINDLLVRNCVNTFHIQ